MYRLMIVEDEKWEREGLRDFLDWDGMGIEVACCACNGAEGLKMAELYRPEIILTDIVMPKMDGIRMSRDIRALLPETKIIILSGHDDFQFAKQAFGFHAFAYVLKPVVKKNLEEVLFRVLKVLDQEKNRKNEREALKKQWTDYVNTNGDRLLLDLLEGKAGLKYVDELTHINGLNLNGKKATAILSLFFSPDGTKRTEPELLDAFGNLMRQMGIAFSFIKPLKEAAICIDVPDTRQELERQLLQLRDKLLKELGINTIIGAGAVADDFAGVPQSYNEAREASSYRFLAEYGEIIFYGNIKGYGLAKQEEPGALIMKINGITRKIAYSIQKGDIDESALLLDAFLSALREDLPAGRMLLAGFFTEILSSLGISLSSDTSENTNEALWNKKGYAMDLTGFDSLSQTRRYIIDFLKDIAAHIKGRGSRSEFEIVKKVIGIIEARYFEDLDLILLSEEIHLSPYYIGSIFKKFTGKVFSQYLNDYRIDMAKEILQSKKVKMNHLGETVGIRNPSYFCVLFKNRFGISPGEYKEILKGRRERV